MPRTGGNTGAFCKYGNESSASITGSVNMVTDLLAPKEAL